MKKVIAVLPDDSYKITTAENAVKNRWYVAYNVTVVKSEIAPDPAKANQLPVVGTIMEGIGGFFYKIATLYPTYVCTCCDAKNSKQRIEKKWYCNTDFKKLVVTQPIVKTNKIPDRNDSCSCGSGKKYKHCCMAKSRHTPRHYFNSAYKQTKSA